MAEIDVVDPPNVTYDKRLKLLGCKLGTQPRVLVVDGRSTIKVGRVIRVREWFHGSRWFEAKVDDINTMMVFLSYFP